MGSHRQLQNSYLSDWSAGLGPDWANILGTDPSTHLTISSKEYLRLPATYRLMPRFVIGSDASFDVTVDVRPVVPAGGYHGIVLYSGEQNYVGLYLGTFGKVYLHDLSPDKTASISGDMFIPIKPVGWYVDDTDVQVRITYDPATFQTKLYLAKDGGALELVWTRTSISGGGLYTDWIPALSIWISGLGGRLDVGDIAINRDSTTTVLAGAADYYGWGYQYNNTLQTMDFTPYLTYYGPAAGYPTETPTANVPAVLGSLEGFDRPEGLTFMDFQNEDSDVEYMAGAFTILSGAINGTVGRLRLYGDQGPEGQGHMRVRVLGAAQTLISDAVIPGNSAGFFPDNGAYVLGAEVDLSAVTDETIYLEFDAAYTGVGAVRYYGNAAPWVPPPTIRVWTVETRALSISDAYSSSTADSLTITLAGGTLVISDSFSASSVENLTLAPVAGGGTLDISSAFSGSIADNLTLTLAGGILAIADAMSASFADNIALSPVGATWAIKPASSGTRTLKTRNGSPLTLRRNVSGIWQ
jgi:hypothetical protein